MTVSRTQQVLGPLKDLLDENLNLRVIQSVELLSKLSVSCRQNHARGRGC